MQKTNNTHGKNRKTYRKTIREAKKNNEILQKDHGKWIKTVEQGVKSLGIPLDSNQLNSLFFHGSELMMWNKKFNITSITDPDEIAVKHFIDCLALVPLISDDTKVLDIGSGGGFPGLPLKIANPTVNITMIDASRKKVSFLNHIIRSLKITGIHAVHTRCEDFAKNINFQHGFDYVVSRAFTSLDRFIQLARPFLSEKGIILAMKGQNPDQEIQLIRQEKIRIKKISYLLPVRGYHRSIIKILLSAA